MHVRLGCPHAFLLRCHVGSTGLLHALVAPGILDPSSMHAMRNCVMDHVCQTDHDHLCMLNTDLSQNGKGACVAGLTHHYGMIACQSVRGPTLARDK